MEETTYFDEESGIDFFISYDPETNTVEELYAHRIFTERNEKGWRYLVDVGNVPPAIFAAINVFIWDRYETDPVFQSTIQNHLMKVNDLAQKTERPPISEFTLRGCGGYRY